MSSITLNLYLKILNILIMEVFDNRLYNYILLPTS
jgi:hypothetical protein